MRLEFEPNASVFPIVETGTVKESSASEAEQSLRDGVKAAQEGRRAEAKAMLLRTTELAPQNENAWLWLASISEYPEELLVFLNNVLKINPANERALEWKKATQSLLAKTLVQRGVDASKDNRNDFARQCFEQAVEHDAENEMAWLWLASVADSDREKAELFEKVLNLNPQNETAQASLQSLQSQKTAALLRDALAEAVEGHHQTAQQILAIVLDQNAELEEAWILKAHLAGSFEERAESLLKIRALNPENEMANACLASWRMLVERATSAHRAPMPEEMTDDTEQESENQEVLAEKYSFSEEYAAPDSPTQDLHSVPHFAPEEFSDENTPFAEPAFEPAEQTGESPEFENFSGTSENASAAEEFQSPEAAPEVQPDDTNQYLASEIEADEDEMSWAFAETPENFEAQSSFYDFSGMEEKPLPENGADDFPTIPEANFEAVEESEMNRAADSETRQSEEEWRNTSPDVFVGYVPESVNYQSLAAISATEPEMFESAAHQEFQEDSAPVEETAPAESPVPVNFEDNNFAEDFAESSFSEPSAEFFVEEPFRAPVENNEQSFAPAETTLSPEFFEMPQPEPAVAESFESDQVAEEKPAAEFSQPAKVEMMLCPFCNAENERQSFSCQACGTVLSLTDLEMLLNHHSANEEVLQQAVASFEREHEGYGLNAEQLAFLGIGQLNLKNYRQGFSYLQEAVQMNPSNVVLDAQVNALAIRLAEMEKQQSVHDSMPKNRKILVIDDSPTVRKLISSKLEKCGHEVVCAVDGLDALEKLNSLTPDLILLDITMPRMDGYQVCKLIRNNADTKEVPVVMISGKDGFFDKVRGRMAGTTDYITKPFGPETLMKTVENYLN